MNNILNFLLNLASYTEAIANLILIFAFIKWAWSYRFVTCIIGNKKIRMRAKDVNASSLTNAFSKEFYEGANIPGPIRQEIIEFTNPPYKVEK